MCVLCIVLELLLNALRLMSFGMGPSLDHNMFGCCQLLLCCNCYIFTQGLLHDTVANIREKALGHVFDLLYNKPEQEQLLLSQLVNKLGDPIRKIASKSSLFLLKLCKCVMELFHVV